MIHGGFWRDRYDRTLMHAVCEDLGARGWAAWNLEYRRLGEDGGGWPGTLDDVAAAIDHLAELPGLDLSRAVAIGHSAGGHLAAWAAGRDDARVPLAGAVAQAGVLDLRRAWELGLSKGVVGELLGGEADRCALASPIERLPLGVPLLLTHGGQDDDVPPEISVRYLAAARAAGDPCELVLLAEEDHYGHLDPANPLWGAVVEWLAARIGPRA